MRTRSRLIPAFAETKRTVLWQNIVGSKIKGTDGVTYYDCLPVHTTQPTTTNEPAGTAFRGSVIVDQELSVDRGIKYVSHTKWEPFVWPVHTHNSSLVTSYRTFPSANSGRVAYPAVVISNSIRPAREAYTYTSGRWVEYQSGNTGMMSKVPFLACEDKLAQLPSKIVKAIEGVHLSTTAIESRDLPALWRLFTKRGALRDGLSLLKNMTTSHLDQKSTLTRLIVAYKETQLSYTWGLMPTIQDMHNIHQELRKFKNRAMRKKIFSVTLRGESHKGHELIATPGQGSYDSAVLREFARVVRVDGARVTYTRPAYNFDFFEDADNAVRRFLGVNPLGLIWEVFPYSFAMDWLCSVDDVLDTLWLNRQSDYSIQYWTSEKKSCTGILQYRYPIGVEGSYPSARVGSSEMQTLTAWCSSYNRALRDAPSSLDSVRCRGANVYNVFLLALSALRLRK